MEFKNIYILLLFISVDIFTGICKALKHHTLKSAICRNGGFKKYLIILICILSMLIDEYILQENILYIATTLYYVFNEFISICENINSLRIPIPKFLVDFLQNKRGD